MSRWPLLLIGLLLLALSIYVHFLASYYGDKQWEMLYAQMWLSGKKLYVDIFPVSPPLIYWLYAIPAALSQWMGFPGAFPFLISLGLILVAGCIFLSARLIRLHPGFAGRSMRVQFAALLCFVFIFRTSSIYFLDREHLFTVMTFPYLVRFMPALSRKVIPFWLSALVGLLAGIGFCFKPYCLVVWAAIQLATILEQRSSRVLISFENLIIYAVGFTYLLSIWLLYPEYIGVVMPIAFLTYSATRDSSSVLYNLFNVISMLILAFVMFRPRHTSPFRLDIYYICIVFPAYFIYALLNNNWAYTYYPLSSIALILTGFLFWEFVYLFNQHKIRGDRVWPFAVGATACVVTLFIRVLISLNYFSMVMADTCHGNIHCQWDDKMADEFSGQKSPFSFGSISIDFTRWTRLSNYTGALWQTRFPQLWMLPKFLVSGDAFMIQHQPVLDYIAESFASDMDRNKPQLMFVDDTDLFYTAHVHLDLVKFFSANAAFRNAWAHYRFAHVLDLCEAPGIAHTAKHDSRCRYFVYQRID